MIVTAVTVYVKKENLDDFIKSIVENHTHSILEPGNLRFDVLQCIDDQCRFLLYEAYESEEASAAHKNTPHYKKWKEIAESWMAKPREGIRHRVIAPLDKKSWK